MYTEDSNNLKKASISSPYELNRFNAKWNVPEEFRGDVTLLMKKIFSLNVLILKVLKPEFLIKSLISKVLTL